MSYTRTKILSVLNYGSILSLQHGRHSQNKNEWMNEGRFGSKGNRPPVLRKQKNACNFIWHNLQKGTLFIL